MEIPENVATYEELLWALVRSEDEGLHEPPHCFLTARPLPEQ